MMLLIDIGNTMTKICLSNGKNLLMIKKYNTYEISKSFMEDFSHENIDKALICSVKKSKTFTLRNELEKMNIECLEVKKEINISLDSEYDMEAIGPDRLVNIYAAKIIYGSPIVIASIGTAFTVDFVNSSGLHKGGMISAGPNIIMDSLSNSTDTLFKVKLRKTEKLFEKNTDSAINSGILNSYSLFLEGLRQRVPENTKFILTGGFSPMIAMDDATIFPELLFQGLLSAYERR